MRPTHYYAQSFPTDPKTHLPSAEPLQRLLDDPHRTAPLVLYLASLHVGVDPQTHRPYLHLNDDDVGTVEPFLEDVRRRCDACNADPRRPSVEVRVMLGGAGGAYTALFADFEPRYALLRAFLCAHASWLRGLDLDIEEPLADDPNDALDRVRMLLRRLHADLPCSFTLTMAPVAFALTDDAPGMGGFVYRELAATPEGKLLGGYNAQAYGCFDLETFRAVFANGFGTPAAPVVWGMLGDEYADATAFGTAMTELEAIAATAHTGFGGAVLWEFGDTRVDPLVWGQAVQRATEMHGGTDAGGTPDHSKLAPSSWPVTWNAAWDAAWGALRGWWEDAGAGERRVPEGM